ncbi:MAG TPA: MFS transporter [Solirubrobacterales bacterium]|nr:MFS transporter [Solirubrobacterales bacterium]
MTEIALEQPLASPPREAEREPRRGLVVALVTAAMFIDAVFFAVIAPLLPHYSETLGLSHLEVALLFAAHPAGTLLCAPFAAALVRRGSARMTMTLGLVGLGIGSIVFGFADSLALLAGCRFVQGASAAMVWCAGLARLQNAAPPERRGAVLGLAGSAAGAGSLLGPAFAALSAVASIEAVLLVLGLLTLVLCAALRSAGDLPDERCRDSSGIGRQSSTSQGEGGSIGAGRRASAAAITVIVVCGTVFGAVATLAPLRLADLGAGVTAIAAAFALSAVGEMFAAPLAGHYSDRVGRLRPIRLCLLIAVPLLALQALTGSPWILGAAVALVGAIIASLWPLGTAFLGDESVRRGGSPAGVFAVSVVAWSAGLAGGSLLCGALAEGAGTDLAYVALIVACGLALLTLAPVSAPRAPSPE